VWKIQTPEDIAKWREDRKRNFPTVARVAQRKRELKERKKRGNVLNNQYFGKINGDFQGRRRNDPRGSGRGMSRMGRVGRGGRGARGGSSFRPIDNEFGADSDQSSSDEDDDKFSAISVSQLQEKCSPSPPPPPPPTESASPESKNAGILGSLASAYASSDEDDDEDGGGAGPESGDHLTRVKNNEKLNANIDASTGIDSNGNNSTSKSPCISPKESKESSSTGSGKKEKRRKRKAGEQKEVPRLLTDGQVKYQLTKKRQRREPTLLERLLAPEIRRERNYILQCVRYIVRKNFFDD